MNMVMPIDVRRPYPEHMNKFIDLCLDLLCDEHQSYLFLKNIADNFVKFVFAQVIASFGVNEMIFWQLLFRIIDLRGNWWEFCQVQVQTNAHFFLVVDNLFSNLAQLLHLLLNGRCIDHHTYTGNTAFLDQLSDSSTPFTTVPIVISIDNEINAARLPNIDQ